MIFWYANDVEYNSLLKRIEELGVDYIDDSYEEGSGCFDVDVEDDEEIEFLS